MSKKAIDKEYLLNQLHNYEEDILDPKYLDESDIEPLSASDIEAIKAKFSPEISTIPLVTTSTDGLMIATDKVKLDSLISLPAGGTANQILTKSSSTDGDADWEDVESLSASDMEDILAKFSPTYSSIPGATTSTDGLMTAADKAKLNGITDSADAVSYTQVLSSTGATKIGTITINSSATDLYAPSDNDHRKTFIGVCNTAASTAEKTVTLENADGWEFKPGIIVGVKFTNENTADKLTLNVNSSGAYEIEYSINIVANQFAYFMLDYDESYYPAEYKWRVISDGLTWNYASTSAPGNIASSSSIGTSAKYARQDHTHGISLATGDANGQVKVAGTNVSVKGLGTAAYTDVETLSASDIADIKAKFDPTYGTISPKVQSGIPKEIGTCYYESFGGVHEYDLYEVYWHWQKGDLVEWTVYNSSDEVVPSSSISYIPAGGIGVVEIVSDTIYYSINIIDLHGCYTTYSGENKTSLDTDEYSITVHSGKGSINLTLKNKGDAALSVGNIDVWIKYVGTSS